MTVTHWFVVLIGIGVVLALWDMFEDFIAMFDYHRLNGLGTLIRLGDFRLSATLAIISIFWEAVAIAPILPEPAVVRALIQQSAFLIMSSSFVLMLVMRRIHKHSLRREAR